MRLERRERRLSQRIGRDGREEGIGVVLGGRTKEMYQEMQSTETFSFSEVYEQSQSMHSISS